MDIEALVNLWLRQFDHEAPQAVGAAVDCLIATRTVGYSPTIGEIKVQLHQFRTQDQLSEVDAWVLVERACRNGLYHAQEEYDKLPPDVQRAVGGPEQLKAWAQMDSETVGSVIASNFRKSYTAVQEREKQRAMCPPDVRKMLSGIADPMRMENSKQSPFLPARLEPLKPMEPPPSQELQRRNSNYTPPSADDWERRRAEAVAKLTG